ncbi:NAD(P)H-binding protein [Sphingomonas phyllosphaerae]|uniref:NAD(P)H-binding protein n=1 Tax=Sphingomonas phyllosphaerae TaxID=257003 RepID=UPI000419ED5B|nr:NAD(P)H-binding protein [Sphingomonas phyllosphaerae]
MNILIIGAHGQIARVATPLFLAHPEVRLTLFLRRAARLRDAGPGDRVRVVEGDATDEAALAAARAEQDAVYVNLAGDLPRQAHAIVAAMKATGVRRLVFISSMGVYDEVPGERHGSILDPYREATRIVETSGLDYTIVRPAWLNDRDEVSYGTTRKGEPFANAQATVSRKSVADLVVGAVIDGEGLSESLGVHAA